MSRRFRASPSHTIKNSIVLAASILVVSSGCKSKHELPATISFTSQTYDAADMNMSVPAKWIKRELSSGAVLFVGSSEVPAGNFPPNVNVVRGVIPRESKLTTCLRGAESAYKDKPGFREFDVADVTISGLPGKRVVLEVNMQEQVVDVVFYLVKSEDQLLVLTCASAISSFHTYEPIFDQVAGSIHVK